MKHLWYNIVKTYVKIGLFFLIKKKTVFGKENIPKKGALIFLGNHQNALIDSILIPTNTSRNIHFLTRASAFKNGIVNRLLRSINMIPVYRVRDGVKTIEKNYEIFKLCYEYLSNQKAIEIFPEGIHHLKRKVLPFKKGFARIIEGTLQKYPDLEIKIIPVGFNYDSHLSYPQSVSIYFGEPILANRYFDLKNDKLNFNEIIQDCSEALKKLTLHIKNDLNYEEIIQKLEYLNVDYLDPIEATRLVENIDKIPISKTKKKQTINWFYPIHVLAKINSIIPILIWKFIKPKIEEEIFLNTYRFTFILTVFPLFYCIQACIIASILNLKHAIIYLLISIILGIISTKTMRVTR